MSKFLNDTGRWRQLVDVRSMRPLVAAPSAGIWVRPRILDVTPYRRRPQAPPHSYSIVNRSAAADPVRCR